MQRDQRINASLAALARSRPAVRIMFQQRTLLVIV
jgi:hypothetical protein